MTDRPWVALLSGGKDSSWALHRAIEEGRPVERLLTARPDADSYLFHVPALRLTPLIAESVGLPIDTFPIADTESTDSTTVGDEERDALASEIDRIDRALEGSLAGIVTGAVASRFQNDRLEQLCTERGLEQYAPLWKRDPVPALQRMIDAGFDIRIVAVAAEGLDRRWLGRRLDRAAVAELVDLRDRYGLHVMGEGGEYETIVVDGPHMDERVTFEAEKRWDGTRGRLEVTDAGLER